VTQRDRYILIVIATVGLLGAYWFLALAPKRSDLSKLDKDLSEAQQTLTQSQQEKTEFAQARVAFPALYASLGRLGKAVPADEDVPSLLVQLNHAAAQANVDFRSVELKVDAVDQIASASGPAPAASTPATGASGASGATGTTGTAGAATGTLQPLPFQYTFRGDFYKLTNLIQNVTRLVHERNKTLAISGRLVAVVGFGLTRHKVTILAASYMLPADQGLFAGASPTGPSAATGATPEAASATPAAPAPPTASVTAP
jgi:Pilus assembly protein, PilO